MALIIDCLYVVAILLWSPKIIYRMVRHNRYRTGWGQRLGKITRNNPQKPCIWIHAVSVGEVNATKTLVAGLEKKLPDYEIVISSTTDTGLERAKNIYGKDRAVFYFPFDISWVMKRAFDNIRPNICLLMELEVWPNLTKIAKKNAIPVVVVNGRLSDKSYPLYKLVKPAVKRIFSRLDMVLAQTAEYADRFIALGCGKDRVIITNSLKYDTAQIADRVEGAEKLAELLNISDEKLWVAGGTGPGEEKNILEVFVKLRKDPRLSGLRLAIVPRKPERFDEAAALVGQFGLGMVRYSKIKETSQKISTRPAVILGDTMGDLKKFYSLATVVFVGRSLVPMGGSDMMESAALGKCTTFGPHTFNFKQTVKALLDGVGAIEAADSQELYDITHKCLTDTDFARAIGTAARKVIMQNQGATEKSVTLIASLLK